MEYLPRGTAGVDDHQLIAAAGHFLRCGALQAWRTLQAVDGSKLPTSRGREATAMVDREVCTLCAEHLPGYSQTYLKCGQLLVAA